MPTDSKSVTRSRILNLLRSQKEEARLKKSEVIQGKLFSMPEFKRARTIVFYASLDGEVETFSMMKQAQRLGKKIALPMIHKKEKKLVPFVVEDLNTEIIRGPYGIKQPDLKNCRLLQAQDIDLVVVPAVAFDKHNNRLGRGAGYYDRFLTTIPSQIPIFGLAFDFQIVDRLPHQQNHDVPVWRVIVN